MTRIGDLASQNLTLYYLGQLQARSNAEQMQISSELKADRYKGIASDAPRIVSLENGVTRARQFVDSNNQLLGRLKQTELLVRNVFDLAQRARSDLLSALSREQFDNLLTQGAASTLQEVAGALNSTDGNRYLFSGGRTNTAPVDLSTLPPDGIFVGTAASYYYRGDTQILSARVSPEVTVAHGVTADEQGFEETVRALQMIATVDTSDPVAARATLDAALGILDQAITDLPGIVARIGASQVSLERNTEQHSAFILGAETEITRLQNTDVAEVATRLSADRNTLEASYAALARLRSLSLVDFLR